MSLQSQTRQESMLPVKDSGEDTIELRQDRESNTDKK